MTVTLDENESEVGKVSDVILKKFKIKISIGNLKDDTDLVGVASPPYSQADDRVEGKRFQSGNIADCMTRTYEQSKHSKNPENIANLKDS